MCCFHCVLIIVTLIDTLTLEKKSQSLGTNQLLCDFMAQLACCFPVTVREIIHCPLNIENALFIFALLINSTTVRFSEGEVPLKSGHMDC